MSDPLDAPTGTAPRPAATPEGALKFLPEAVEGDAERLARFYNEARLARQVTHPSV